MKTTTNRIHRNGASKRTASQAQTRDTEKQVRIVISDPDGDPFAEFEISETFHLAMRADAKAKGISLQQWIENAVREKYMAPTASAPAVEDDSVSLVFFSDKEGYSLAHVDLTRPKFEAIRAAASNAGLSLEELLNRGIMRMLDTVNFSTAELESAQYQSNALLQLLAENLEHRDGQHGDHVKVGIQNLVSATQDRLAKAFDETHQAFRSQRAEVAS